MSGSFGIKGSLLPLRNATTKLPALSASPAISSLFQHILCRVELLVMNSGGMYSDTKEKYAATHFVFVHGIPFAQDIFHYSSCRKAPIHPSKPLSSVTYSVKFSPTSQTS